MLNVWTTSLTILITIIIGVTFYIKNLFKHWKNKNVPDVGFKLPSRSKWIGEYFAAQYNWAKKSGYRHLGLFSLWVPTYMPIDPIIIRHILIKDFDHFCNRGLFAGNEKRDPLSVSLFTLEGKKWKSVRNKISPMFTSGKIKMMFKTIVDIADNLKNAVDDITQSGEVVDVKYLFQCFTMDVIGSCAFGLDCDSFKNPDSEFRKYGNKTFLQSNLIMIKTFFGFCSPKLARLIKMRISPKDVTDFFVNVIRQTIAYREENNLTRNDFLQLLINLKSDAKIDNSGLTTEEIAGQSYIFFMAGFETSSNTLAFGMYELAYNTEIQEKLRAEINEVLQCYNSELTYEAISEMKYLDQFFDETLRKYPVKPITTRTVVANYKIPDTDIIIDKNTLVFIPLYPLHHDPEYFPNPEKFDPDRFSPENKSKIVPFTYLPFGDGPRNCIGLRFATTHVKIALVTMVKNYSFTLNSKTTIPLKRDPGIFTSNVLGGVWLDIKKV